MAILKFMVGDEQTRCSSAPIDQDQLVTAQEDQVSSHHFKRPLLRHVAKRKSGGARFMRRSTSMEDTTRRRQGLKPLSPFNSAPCFMTVSPRICAKPVEQTFHATANHRESSHFSSAKTLRSVSNPPPLQRTHLVSQFIQSQSPPDLEKEPYQRLMEEEYRAITHYLHPMESSLCRCLAKKKKIPILSPPHSIHADQRILVHRNHIRPEMPLPIPSPPSSLWDRMWNNLVK